MFWKKRKTITPEVPILSETPWDEQTIKWIAEHDRLDVQITSIGTIKNSGVRRGHQREPGSDPEKTEIYGFCTWPKFIAVSISFERRSKEFGTFCYSYRELTLFARGAIGTKRKLPILEIWLNASGDTASVLRDVHRSALVSGHRHSSVRFWKEKASGWMTAKDKEEGWSYESRYPLLGMVTWDTLQSNRLPSWALPHIDERFSVDEIPSHSLDYHLEL